MPRLYNSRELSDLSGASQQMVKDLARTGKLHPLIHSRNGSDYFPEEDLNILKGILRTTH